MSLVGRVVRFYVVKGKVCGLEHNPRPNGLLIKPIRQCTQYSRFKDLMESAQTDLEGKPDGHYIFKGGWEKIPLETGEEIAIAILKERLNDD